MYQKYVNENNVLDKQIAGIRRLLDSMKKQHDQDQDAINDFNKLPAPFAVAVAPGVAAYQRGGSDPTYYATMQARSNAAAADQQRLEAGAKKLQDDIKDLDAKKNVPTHAGKLIMLTTDGGTLDTIELESESKPTRGVFQ